MAKDYHRYESNAYELFAMRFWPGIIHYVPSGLQTDPSLPPIVPYLTIRTVIRMCVVTGRCRLSREAICNTSLSL
jgi:hypothetical protein